MNMKLVTVPNNVEGKQFVLSLRKFLRNTPHGVMVRGRGNRKTPAVTVATEVGVPTQYVHRQYRQDLPIRFAERLAVYVQRKPTHRYKKVTREVTEWVKVPTKWAK